MTFVVQWAQKLPMMLYMWLVKVCLPTVRPRYTILFFKFACINILIGYLFQILYQVRSALLFKLPDVSRIMSKETVVSRIVPVLQRIAADPSEHVRCSFASAVNLMAPSLERDGTIQFLLPLLLVLLRDEISEVFPI